MPTTLTWQMDEVVELIKGKIFKKGCELLPDAIHQQISIKLSAKLYYFLENKPYQVYDAPLRCALSNLIPRRIKQIT